MTTPTGSADPTVLDVPDESQFELRLADRTVGLARYRAEPGLLVFTHTEVDEEYEGHGLGSVLIRAALDEARSRGLAVRPDCPFVRAYIARHPDEYLDLVPDGMRGDL